MIEALLFAAPVLAVFAPLLAGRYPGENAMRGFGPARLGGLAPRARRRSRRCALRELGWIETERRGVTVLDLEALRRRVL